jgi:hypothetical protein
MYVWCVCVCVCVQMCMGTGIGCLPQMLSPSSLKCGLSENLELADLASLVRKLSTSY